MSCDQFINVVNFILTSHLILTHNLVDLWQPSKKFENLGPDFLTNFRGLSILNRTKMFKRPVATFCLGHLFQMITKIYPESFRVIAQKL